MSMKRLVLFQRSADGERLDRFEFEPGVVLQDISSTSRSNPLVTVSAIEGVELIDVDATYAVTPRLFSGVCRGGRILQTDEAGTPPEELGTPVSFRDAGSVPGHVSPGTRSRWGALPLGEEPPQEGADP